VIKVNKFKMGKIVERKIVFAGHFDIGETVNVVQKQTINDALKIDGDLAILINDIDFSRKLVYYNAFGLEGLAKHYVSRKKCGSKSSLYEPLSYYKIKDIVDTKQYESAVRILSGTKQDWKLSKSFKDAVREYVVPELIDYTIRQLELEKVRIEYTYTESHLRNIASNRLKKSRKNSWRSTLESSGMLDEVRAISGSPLCGGILLALYEQVAAKGYTTLMQFYDNEDRWAIENAEKLYAKFREMDPTDKRWQLKFEDKFY
jgi:hypothetical protein